LQGRKEPWPVDKKICRAEMAQEIIRLTISVKKSQERPYSLDPEFFLQIVSGNQVVLRSTHFVLSSFKQSADRDKGFLGLAEVEAIKYFKSIIYVQKIIAKKWGDTEIAERGRSVLVMRARYRSAGLTPHQRGWTDAD